MFFGEVVVDPSWTFALAEALGDRWYETDDVDLTFPETLEQLRSWLEDPRDFEKRHAFYWRAAIKDFEHGAERLGPRYARGLAPHLDALRSALAGLPAAGARERVALAHRLLLALDRASCAEDALLLAWQDLAASVRDGLGHEAVRLRTALLRALLERSQRGCAGLLGVVAGVLRDRSADVRGARHALGEPTGPDAPARRGSGAVAALSEEERLDLAARLLTAAPRRGHHVVWHAFAKARITGMTQTFGPITLYDREWFQGNAAEDGPHRHLLPDEVTREGSFFPADGFPDAPDVVLARVDLGVGALADAPALSRLRARSMILAATFPQDFRGWEMYHGHVHTVDGDFASHHAFWPADEEFGVPHLSMEATADRLDRMGPRIAPHLAGAGADLADVIDAVGWWKASGTQPALPAVVMDVRILELLATRVSGQEWYRYLDDFHKNAWIRQRITEALTRVAWHARDDLGHFPPDVGRAAEALHRTVVRHGGPRFAVDLPRFVSVLPELVEVYPVHSKQRRRARGAAARVAGAEGMRGWHAELEERWSRAVDRLRSVRNSLAHGGPVTPGAAASVAPLAHVLAGTALTDSLASLLEGEPQATAHVERRDAADAWAARWVAGTPAGEMF
ncbi:hypothetical protein ACFWAR_31320 [Streptomyces sp. NPDC059917]|uniref:hypothetical protein n=1 Tax=Streptomyces sp. NPDC059917 TaxID=3347002 RepID=UPI00364E2849